MKKTVTILTLCLVALVFSGGVSAQGADGGTRSIFFLGAGSRAIAMGGAFSAIGNDPSVLYYNPAALQLNPYPAVMANHIQLFSDFSDVNYDFFGLVYPTLSIGSFGIGFMTAGTGGIRQFDSSSIESDKKISYRESQTIMAYAFDFPWEHIGRFSLGASVKILNQRIGDFSDNGTGVDAGLIYRQDYLKGLIIGCNIQDIIGAETKLVDEKEKVDRTLMLGIGYSHLFSNGSTLCISVQVDMPERADNDLRFGAEYDYKQLLSFRAGFDSESVTAGVGFGWGRYKGDYGFFSREEAGSSHPFSVLARIGTSVEDRIRIEEEIKLANENKRIAEIFAARVSKHISAAAAFVARDEHESALDELKIALEYDPTNKKAAVMLDQVRQQIVELQSERTKTTEKRLLINQHFSLGMRYYSNSEYILARAQWRNVLEIDPDNEDAREYFDKTEKKLDELARQHKDDAIANERNGKLAAALAEWNLVRIIDPKNEGAISATARITRKMEVLNRDYRAASRRLETIKFFEDALIEFSEGRYSEAADLLRRVIERQPDHEEAVDLLNRVQRKMVPLTDEEKEQIRQFYITGMKSFTLGDYSAAIAAWQKIISIDPDNASVRKNIEEARQRLKKLGSSEVD